MFIMDGIHEDFDTPQTSSLTLFKALFGDFDFDGFSTPEEGGGNEILLQAAHFFIIIYVLVASIVLLNILIAMMAKTFDNIHEGNKTTIIFLKFAVSLEWDRYTSFMPPPLNVIAIPLLLIFYVIEYPINWLRKLFHIICISRSEFKIFDLSLYLMPRFMKQRKLELDEQICFNNCKKTWSIKTNQGFTECAMINFNGETMKHKIKFFRIDPNSKRIRRTPVSVSIHPDVKKQEIWDLNILELEEKGLIDLSQFNTLINNEWIDQAHNSMQTTFYKSNCGTITKSKLKSRKTRKSPYWICAYCRGYVKLSKVSIIRLGKKLNLNDIEMATVHKISPEICPNCYRGRTEMKRYELVGEIISLWVFYIFVWIFLIFIFGAFKFITAPIVCIKYWIKSCVNCLEENEKGCIHQCCIREKSKKHFCNYYYNEKLNENMKTESSEDKLFDPKFDNHCWKLLDLARNSVDPWCLRNRIRDKMMEVDIDRELTEFEFVTDFVGANELKKIYGDGLWINYLEPLSMSIYERIKEKSCTDVPLHLFLKYPLDANICLDELHQFWNVGRMDSSTASALDLGVNQRKAGKRRRSKSMSPSLTRTRTESQSEESKDEEKHIELNPEQAGVRHGSHGQLKRPGKHLVDCSKQDIIDALRELKFLNCKNDIERRFILDTIEVADEYLNEVSIYHKFIKYLFDVESLFQSEQKINTLLRDVRMAMNERGIDKKVNRDELQFLCQEINQVLVIPFMNTIQRKGNSLYLWDIWNNLIVLNYLHKTVKKSLNHKHSTVRINERDLKALILTEFENDLIIDQKQNSWRDRLERSRSDEFGAVMENDGHGVDYYYNELNESPLYQKKESIVHDLVTTSSVMEDMVKGIQHSPKSMESLLKQESRIASYYTSKITKNELLQKVSGIYLKIRDNTKISVTAINGYYIHEIIRSEEMLDFVYQQLSRYATFNGDKLKNICTENDLIMILTANKNGSMDVNPGNADNDDNDEVIKYQDGYYIDSQSIPLQLKQDNYQFIKDLYQHVLSVYIHSGLGDKAVIGMGMERRRSHRKTFHMTKLTENESISEINQNHPSPSSLKLKLGFGSNSAKSPQTHSNSSYKQIKMALKDIIAIISLYKRIYLKVRRSLVDITELDSVSHNRFVKFVDPAFKCPSDEKRTSLMHMKTMRHDMEVFGEQGLRNEISNTRIRRTGSGQVAAEEQVLVKIKNGDGEIIHNTDSNKIRAPTRIRNGEVEMLESKQNQNRDLPEMSMAKSINLVDSKARKSHEWVSWSKRSRAASNLFHAVLDTQQAVVSLGQVRKMVDTLIEDINGLKCGGIIRIMNHLLEKIISETERKCNPSPKPGSGRSYKEHFSYSRNSRNEDEDEQKYVFSKSGKLKMSHLNKTKWNEFLGGLAKDCHFCNKSCDCKLCTNNFGDYEENMSVMILNDKNDRKIDRNILRLEQEQRNKVFDTMLSFCRNQITLQQMFTFSVEFAKILKKNERITEEMTKYHKFMKDKRKFPKRERDLEYDEYQRIQYWEQLMPDTYEEFRDKYFPKKTDWNSKQEYQQLMRIWREFKPELNWLYNNSKTNAEFCHNINLFWSFKSDSEASKYSIPHGKMVLETYDFITKNAIEINGWYILQPAEFSLLKHGLNISNKSINDLFYIIRRKRTTLSLKQIYGYFTFLLRMKYHVQNSIINGINDEREDTMLSEQGLKIQLNIDRDNESSWLFNIVENEYKGKLTWKQIIKYLQKTLNLRNNMKDFFGEKEKAERDKHGNNLNNNYDKIKSNDALLKELKLLTLQNKKLLAEIQKSKKTQ